ncbi:MAG TPA: putative toxin-antitoxin system toxin component, PIN family [Candidatus Limnocylindrales bacterium]|nr:putative toxin-antitoxin system toxin component, PIN family [Candidatus Limnocylindrales bacterium]
MTVRVVVDTNVFISALLFQGKPARVLQLAEERAFTLLVSAPLRLEVERVLGGKFKWPAHRIVEACTPFWDVAVCVAPTLEIDDCPDSDDNRVLECAVEGKAHCIVTGDHHLLDMRRFREITIFSVDDFLRIA